MRTQSVILLTSGLAVATATAAPLDASKFNPPSSNPDWASVTTGLSAKSDNPLDFPSVAANETVSLALRYWAPPATQSTGNYTSVGEVTATINGGDVSMGTTPRGDQVVARVTEAFAGDNRRVITVTYRTTNFAPLLRPNTQISGQSALLLSWHIGATDPIEFGEWITDVELLGPNQGGLFRGFFDTAVNPDPSPDFVDITGNFMSPVPDGTSEFSLEEGVTDYGLPLVDSNQFGYNRISISYTFNVIPSPATAVLIAGAGLGGLARRRR